MLLVAHICRIKKTWKLVAFSNLQIKQRMKDRYDGTAEGGSQEDVDEAQALVDLKTTPEIFSPKPSK